MRASTMPGREMRNAGLGHWCPVTPITRMACAACPKKRAAIIASVAAQSWQRDHGRHRRRAVQCGHRDPTASSARRSPPPRPITRLGEGARAHVPAGSRKGQPSGHCADQPRGMSSASELTVWRRAQSMPDSPGQQVREQQAFLVRRAGGIIEPLRHWAMRTEG